MPSPGHSECLEWEASTSRWYRQAAPNGGGVASQICYPGGTVTSNATGTNPTMRSQAMGWQWVSVGCLSHFASSSKCLALKQQKGNVDFIQSIQLLPDITTIDKHSRKLTPLSQSVPFEFSKSPAEKSKSNIPSNVKRKKEKQTCRRLAEWTQANR